MGYKKAIINKLLHLLTLGFVVGFMVVIVPEQTLAQLPGLPEPPEQTPIDGGLGVLAALGGAYAIKKIREKE